VAAEEAKPAKSYSDAPIYSHPHLSDTNGTDEPGTIVVGKTPFHFSACTSVTRLGLVPSALARASMAAASASPVILMFEALASPFNLVASAFACASARTAQPERYPSTTASVTSGCELHHTRAAQSLQG
jgi:hypothetical protein